LRSGEFDKIQRAFELTGHSSGVYSFDFSADSSKMVSLSKDGTWRLFNTNVEFEKGQDPQQVQMGSFLDAEPSCVIALSPDAEVVAVAKRGNVSLFSARSGDALGMLANVHASISNMIFDKESKWLLTAGDRVVRVFHNVAGHKQKLIEFRDKLGKANTEGMKKRLQEQVKEMEDKLKALGEH